MERGLQRNSDFVNFLASSAYCLGIYFQMKNFYLRRKFLGECSSDFFPQSLKCGCKKYFLIGLFLWRLFLLESYSESIFIIVTERWRNALSALLFNKLNILIGAYLHCHCGKNFGKNLREAIATIFQSGRKISYQRVVVRFLGLYMRFIVHCTKSRQSIYVLNKMNYSEISWKSGNSSCILLHQERSLCCFSLSWKWIRGSCFQFWKHRSINDLRTKLKC